MLNYLLGANLVLLAVLAVLLWRHQRQLEAQREAIRPLLELAPPPASEVRNLLGQPRPRLISIEILNPMQLAAHHNAFAGLLGNIAPGVIRHEVHRQVVRILKAELAKQEVAAEVRIHGPE